MESPRKELPLRLSKIQQLIIQILITMDNNWIIESSDEDEEEVYQEVVFQCIVDAPTIYRIVSSTEESEEPEEPEKKDQSN